MAWIEVHQSLRDHRKILALAGELEMPEAHVAGHMLYLWLWSLDNAPDGKLPASERIIERAAGWHGTTNSLVAAMVTVGMVDRDDDGCLHIHDWHEYAGRLIEKRKSDAERKRLSRTTVDRPTDVPRMSHGQPTDVAGTVPNLTIPNHHDPSGGERSLQGKNVASAGKAPKPRLAVVGAASAAADAAPGETVTVADHGSAVSNRDGSTETVDGTAPPSESTVGGRRIYTRESPEFQLARRLCDAIRRHKPDARLPQNLQQWCSPMDLAMRRDGRTFEHLCALIDWLPTNAFWRKNVLSAGTFRAQLDRLEMQMEEDAKRPTNGYGPRASPPERPTRAAYVPAGAKPPRGWEDRWEPRTGPPQADVATTASELHQPPAMKVSASHG